MAGHSHNLLCHLVHIYLEGEWREDGGRRRMEGGELKALE